ncbi:unnamed protein product [Pedinophyceae sp. YPF-701]|nr:unnamed protein product [Pedinophyceae sp. YPF-701]
MRAHVARAKPAAALASRPAAASQTRRRAAVVVRAEQKTKLTVSARKESEGDGQLVLVGSSPALGQWDVTKALRTATSDGRVWRTEVELPRGSRTEFKLALVRPDGSTVWENVGNRTAKLADGATNLELLCTWDDEHSTEIRPMAKNGTRAGDHFRGSNVGPVEAADEYVRAIAGGMAETMVRFCDGLVRRTDAQRNWAQSQGRRAFLARNAEKAKIRISTNYETGFGQTLAIVGDGPWLGDWDVDRAPRMKWHEGHVWRATVELPRGFDTEFKLVVVNDGGGAIWEEGENRMASPAKDSQFVDLWCNWGDVYSTHVVPPSKLKVYTRYETAYGQYLALIGDGPALGDWDINKAPRMEWSEEHVWKKEVEVPRSSETEFKLVLLNDAGEQLWEQGINRVAPVSDSAESVEVVCDWDYTAATSVATFREPEPHQRPQQPQPHYVTHHQPDSFHQREGSQHDNHYASNSYSQGYSEDMTRLRVSTRKATMSGYTLVLVGDGPTLGNWDVTKAPRMTIGDGNNLWYAEVDVPRGARTDFKLAMEKPDGSYTFEAGANRVASPSEKSTFIELSCEYDNTAYTILAAAEEAVPRWNEPQHEHHHHEQHHEPAPAYAGEMATMRVSTLHETALGQYLVLVGDGPGLGNWNVRKAPKMTWCDGHLWQAEAEVPLNRETRFKLVLCSDNGDEIWEAGDNRAAVISEKFVDLACLWNDTEATLIVPMSALNEAAERAIERERAEAEQAAREANGGGGWDGWTESPQLADAAFPDLGGVGQDSGANKSRIRRTTVLATSRRPRRSRRNGRTTAQPETVAGPEAGRGRRISRRSFLTQSGLSQEEEE